MSPWIETVWKILLGIFLKHIWDRFAGRTTYLIYTVNTVSVGHAVTDPRYGTVQVTYNGNAMANLYFCKVTVENRSNRDIKGMNLNVYGDQGNQILMSHGYVVGSPNGLEFTPQYSQILANAQNDANALATALGRRDYVVPVLNRGSVVSVEFLGNRPDRLPAIYASCDHGGVKMKYVKSLPHFFGEPTNYCAWMGSLLAIGLCFPLYKYVPADYQYLAIFGAATLGILAVFLGWMTMKVVRGISRVIG